MSAGTETPESDSGNLTRLLGFIAMILGMFMAVLDIQVVSSSLPVIQAAIGAGADEVSWVQTAYLVAEVVMVPLSAWLAAVLSTRWLFVTSCGGFTLMSIGCALAWDPSSMVGFRIFQGFIGGAMIPIAFSVVYTLFPQRQQSLALMVTGLTATIAPALGPSLGGWLTDNWSWQWLFLINVVPGIVACIAVGFCVRIDRPNLALLRRIDLPGIVLVGLGLGALQIVLERGPHEDWFDAGYITLCTWIAVSSLLLLIWRELSIMHPVLDLRVLRDRNLAVGCGFNFVIGAMFYGQSYAVPLLLASIRGFDSLQIGETIAVTGAAMFIGAPLAAGLGRVIDPRLLLGIGLALTAYGYWLNGAMTTQVGFDQLILPQAVRGIGLMLAAVPITELCLGTLPIEQLGQGSAVFNVFRNTGGAVGIALVSVADNDRTNRDFARLRDHVEALRPGLAAMRAQLRGLDHAHRIDSGMLDALSLKQIAAEVLAQATVMGWNDTFRIIAVAACLPLLLLPLLRRGHGGPVPMH